MFFFFALDSVGKEQSRGDKAPELVAEVKAPNGEKADRCPPKPNCSSPVRGGGKWKTESKYEKVVFFT